MTTSANHFDLDLERRALFSLPDAAGVNIECRDGSVWITLDNDSRDYVLEAGERFINNRHTPALVYALRPSRIAITRPKIDRPCESRSARSKQQRLGLEQVLAWPLRWLAEWTGPVSGAAKADRLRRPVA